MTLKRGVTSGSRGPRVQAFGSLIGRGQFFSAGGQRDRKINSSRTYLISEKEYGEVFETWFINQCFALKAYHELDLKFSYLRTKDDAEIDLVVEYPDGKIALVEVKSANHFDGRQLKHLKSSFPTFQMQNTSASHEPHRVKELGKLIFYPTSWL
ncbi:MAG: DUF4143 domain-containing protein [Bdellovibrio sp.]|jgi:hypothetical protein